MTGGKNKKQAIMRIARLTAIISAGLFVIGIIGFKIISNSFYNRQRQERETREQSLAAIVRQLEFNGLEGNVQESMAQYSSQYTDYSNFIIIDGGFKVLYSLNKGYLDGTGKFFGLNYTEEYNRYGVVCNANGEILSTHALVMDNYEAFLRLSKTCTVVPKALYGTQDNSHDVVAENYEWSSGGYAQTYVTMQTHEEIRADTNMYFAPIAAKNLYLYFIYDTNTPKWTGAFNPLNNLRSLGTLAAIILFMLYWIALPVWVFLDASRRNNHPALWGVLTLFTNFVGLIVYLVVRPEALTCKTCNEPIELSYAYCPVCGELNRERCPGCKELVQAYWMACPYCGATLVHEAPEPEENQTDNANA